VNRQEKARGVLGDMHRTAISRLHDAGPNGLTWGELGEREGWHHGRVSSVLSDLHREGQIARLAGKGSLREGTRSHIYVTLDHVEGRQTGAYGGTKASEALKALPERDARIAELEQELALFRQRTADPSADLVAANSALQMANDAYEIEKQHHADTVKELAKADQVNVDLAVALEKERAKVQALRGEHYQAEQVLGRAMDFPEGYPDVNDVDDGSVEIGEHTLVSLAQHVASHVEKLRGRIDALTVDLFEADQRIVSLRETLKTEREASTSAQPVIPSTNAEEREFIEKVRKMITGKPDTQVQPARVGSLRNLLALVDRLGKS
jgi:hypothetical protein